MGKATFKPIQQNWQFWEDDAAEPTASYAAENTTFTMANSNTDILRLRVTINETGGAAANNAQLSVLYSLDNSVFVDLGAANHWEYADGQATEGNAVTGLKLADSDSNGEYHESDSNNANYGIASAVEVDVAFTATGNVTGSTLYYFRANINGTEVPLSVLIIEWIP